MRKMSELVRNQNPLMLPPTATTRDACRSMRERCVGAVLVIGRDGNLVGVFTGRDAVCRVLAEGKDPGKTQLSEVMTPKPTTVGPYSTVIEALRLMTDRGVRHLPVVDGGKVLGMVSKGDFRGREHDRIEEETELWERI